MSCEVHQTINVTIHIHLRFVLEDCVPASLTDPNHFLCPARIMIRYLVMCSNSDNSRLLALFRQALPSEHKLVIYLVFYASLPMMQFGRDVQYLVFYIKHFLPSCFWLHKHCVLTRCNGIQQQVISDLNLKLNNCNLLFKSSDWLLSCQIISLNSFPQC